MSLQTEVCDDTVETSTTEEMSVSNIVSDETCNIVSEHNNDGNQSEEPKDSDENFENVPDKNSTDNVNVNIDEDDTTEVNMISISNNNSPISETTSSDTSTIDIQDDNSNNETITNLSIETTPAENQVPSAHDFFKTRVTRESISSNVYDMNTYEGRIGSIENQLMNPNVRIINKNELHEFVFHHGVPDRRGIRSLVWKLLLGYLSYDKNDWSRDLSGRRKDYEMYLRELTANPYRKVIVANNKETTNLEASITTQISETKEQSDPDECENNANTSNNTSSSTSSPSSSSSTDLSIDPLSFIAKTNNKQTTSNLDNPTLVDRDVDPLSLLSSPSKSSSSATITSNLSTVSPDEDPLAGNSITNEWTKFYKDEEIRTEIEKDVKRTYSSLHFFQLPVHPDDMHEVMRLKEIEEKMAAQLEQRDNQALFADYTGYGSVNMSNTAGVSSRYTQMRNTSKSRNKIPYGIDPTHAHLEEIVIGVDKGPDCHHDVLRRLLFLYAKLNPGVRYVQGMNEILAPIYYVFASDPDYVSTGKGVPYKTRITSEKAADFHEGITSMTPSMTPSTNLTSVSEKAELKTSETFEASEIPKISEISETPDETLTQVTRTEEHDEHLYLYSDAEVDAFYCFTNVMAELRDRFIKHLDDSETGVLATVNKLDALLKTCDEELWSHMTTLGVDPRFYAFRWLTLLSSQEFELPDVIRLWDSFFADRKRFDLHLYFCVAMLVFKRDDLLATDFAGSLRLLQRYPETDIQKLFSVAHDLRKSVETGGRSQYVPAPVPKDQPLSPTVLFSRFMKSITKK